MQRCTPKPNADKTLFFNACNPRGLTFVELTHSTLGRIPPEYMDRDVRVARNIVSDIRNRSLRPGSKLEPEHVMVEQQGAARATVREALRFLEFQGALGIKAGPGGGPVVNVPGLDHLTSALSLQLQFADATFRSVLDARRAI